jgi:hypothetical protein
MVLTNFCICSAALATVSRDGCVTWLTLEGLNSALAAAATTAASVFVFPTAPEVVPFDEFNWDELAADEATLLAVISLIFYSLKS